MRVEEFIQRYSAQTESAPLLLNAFLNELPQAFDVLCQDFSDNYVTMVRALRSSVHSLAESIALETFIANVQASVFQIAGNESLYLDI